MALKGRSKDVFANQVVFEAMMCKALGCRPSELEEESAEKLLLFAAVYAEMAKKNPMGMM